MTGTLQKAILIRLKRVRGTGKNAKTTLVPDERGAFPVQFNPTSLRVSHQNNVVEGGATTLTQRKQNPATQSATLTFDLEFDTAEESGENGPVDVRTRTAIIRQFVQPSPDAPKEPPPLLKFLWGTFTFIGIVSQVVEDIDLFSPEGRPLRAKASVTMKEVRLDIEAETIAAGARTSDGATPPGKPNLASGAPGSPPVANPDTAALARLGESLQQLLARLGADPATWRAAMAGLDSPLALAAGAQVQFAAGASAALGLGVTAGFAATGTVSGTAVLAGALGVGGGAGFAAGAGISGGVSASVGGGFSGGVAGGFSGGVAGGFSASVGDGISASVGGGVSASCAGAAGGPFGVADAGAAAAFALAEAGGVAVSANIVAAAGVQADVAAARAAFDVPVTASARGVVGGPVRPVDPRTQSFGRGIPLQVRVGDVRATGA